MLDFDELAELDGLISRDVGELLYDYASRVEGDKSIVELGSYRGKSTCYLATGALSSWEPRVYAVDAWSSDVSAWRRFALDRLPSPEYTDFAAQIAKAGVESLVTPIRSLTTTAANAFTGAPVGLLYIDGDHHESAVIADFRAWQWHLAPDAVVIFDDYAVTDNPGVSAAVQTLEESGELVDVDTSTAERLAIARPSSVVAGAPRGASK